MKTLIFIFFSLIPAISFAQYNMPVKELKKNIGQIVTVHDSVYSGQLINDTTAMYVLGNADPNLGLTVIHCIKKGMQFASQPSKFIRGIQNGTINVTGALFLINNAPTMIVRDRKSFSWRGTYQPR
jgi:hypothetical protein